MDLKIISAVAGVALSVFGYGVYFRGIFKGVFKPHAFTWLIWGVLTWIAFVAQVQDGAGVGAWVTAVMGIASVLIFVLALVRGEKNITTSDWISLVSAGIALLVWLVTSQPLISVCIAILIDNLGLYPTLRKSWHKPYQESLINTYAAALKFVFALIALENYSLLTWLYPASLVLANVGTIVLLEYRRRVVDNTSRVDAVTYTG